MGQAEAGKNKKKKERCTIFFVELFLFISHPHPKSKNAVQKHTKCAFGLELKIKIISLFSLFLLLFIGPTALFGTIHGFHCTISLTFTSIYSTFSNNFSVLVK